MEVDQRTLSISHDEKCVYFGHHHYKQLTIFFPSQRTSQLDHGTIFDHHSRKLRPNKVRSGLIGKYKKGTNTIMRINKE